jgi:hypothetical protein
MLPRFNCHHDLIIRQDGRNRHCSLKIRGSVVNQMLAKKLTARQSLAETHDIRFDIFMVDAKHFPRSAQSRLYLVGNEEHSVLVAQFPHTSQVTLRDIVSFSQRIESDLHRYLIRDYNSRFTLNRLNHKCSSVRCRNGLLEAGEVVVLDVLETGHKRTEIRIATWVGG